MKQISCRIFYERIVIISVGSYLTLRQSMKLITVEN